MKILAVIPCYNTGDICKDIINETAKYADVFAINDGSRDNTLENIRQSSCTLINYENNMGKGYVLIETFKALLEKNNFDAVITIDGDGQHNPEEIPKLIEYYRTNKDDLIIGSRTNTRNMPWKSKIGNILTGKLFKIMYGYRLSDTQSGFRLISRDFLSDIVKSIKGKRFETETEILILAARKKYSIGSVAIDTIYINKNKATNFNPILDSYRIYKSLFRYSLIGIMTAAIDFSIYILLVKYFKVFYLAAQLISRISGAFFHFNANKYFTFKRTHKTYKLEIGKYILLLTFNYFITSIFLLLFVGKLGFNKIFAKIIVETLMFFVNFLLLKNKILIPDRGRGA